jgi:DNA replication protein DnaC
MRKLEMAIEKGFDDHKHGQVLDYFCNVPLLAFDDLGKERLTARMESDLFAIIDERTSNLRPTIITTNYNGTTLLDRFNNKETGEAILRRLREYYQVIAI